MTAKPTPRFKRILLKVSGEALMGDDKFGHNLDAISRICTDIKSVHDLGLEVCLVVGGGNIFRGETLSSSGLVDRASADYMGMLGTVINALALQSCLEKMGTPTRVLSAITMTTIAEPYIRRRAVRHMEKGRMIIFAAGTGNPFFTTDSAAALRASEMGCDALFKGTQVDGVYSADPKKDKHAKRYTKLSYKEVLANDLAVMDASAITLARQSDIPILIFSIKEEGAFKKAVLGEGTYTIVDNNKE